MCIKTMIINQSFFGFDFLIEDWPASVAEWSKVLPLAAWSLSLTTAGVQIHTGVCKKITSDLQIYQLLQFPLPLKAC